MISGEPADTVTPFDDALDALERCLDGVVKRAGDGGLEDYDDLGQIAAMRRFEQCRNTMAPVDHPMVAEIQRRDLATTWCQGSVRRVLTAALSISKAEAGRRVKAAAAVGPRTSPLGQPLPVIRPHLAAAQQSGQLSTEKVAIIERAISRVDRPGFDPADVDAC